MSVATQAYHAACGDQGISPTPAVQAALTAASETGSLHLRGAALGSKGLFALLQALEVIFVEQIHGSSTSVNDGSSPGRKPTPPVLLHTVILSHCYLGDEGCAVVCNVLARIASMTNAHATSAAVPDSSSSPDATSAQSSNATDSAVTQSAAHGFRHLDLSGNGIRDAAPIASLLAKGVAGAALTLETLVLEWNKLGQLPASFMILAHRVAVCERLATVNLANNLLAANSLDAVCAIMKDAPALRALSLAWNALGATAGTAMLEALQSSNSLRSLDVTGNSIPRSDLDAVATRLIANERTSTVEDAARKAATLAEKRSHQAQVQLEEAFESRRNAEAELRAARRDAEAMKLRAESAETRLERVIADSDARIASLQRLHDDALQSAAESRRAAIDQAQEASARVVQAVAQADEARLTTLATTERLRGEIDGLREKISTLENELHRGRAVSSGTEAALELANGEVRAAKADVARIAQSLADSEAHRVALQSKVERLEREAAEHAEDHSKLRDKAATSNADLLMSQSRVRELEALLSAEALRRQRELEDVERRAQEAAKVGEAERERAHRADAETAATYQRRLGESETEVARLRAKLESVTNELDETSASLREVRALQAQDAVRATADIAAAKAAEARAEASRKAAEDRATNAQRDAISQMEQQSRRFSAAIEDVTAAYNTGKGSTDAEQMQSKIALLERQLAEAADRNKRLDQKLRHQMKNVEASVLQGVRAALSASSSGGGGD